MPWRERPGKILGLVRVVDNAVVYRVKPREGTSLIYIIDTAVDVLEGENFRVIALAYCPAAFRTYN